MRAILAGLLLAGIAAACGPYPSARSRGAARWSDGDGAAGSAGALASGGSGPGEGGSGPAAGGSGPGEGGSGAAGCTVAGTSGGEGEPCCDDADCTAGSCERDWRRCGEPGRCVSCPEEASHPVCRCDGKVVTGACWDSGAPFTVCGYGRGEWWCGESTCRMGQFCLMRKGTYRCAPDTPCDPEKDPGCTERAAFAVCPRGRGVGDRYGGAYVYCLD